MKHLLKKAFVGILMLLLFNPAYAQDCMDIDPNPNSGLQIRESSPVVVLRCVNELFQKRAELSPEKLEDLMWLTLMSALIAKAHGNIVVKENGNTVFKYDVVKGHKDKVAIVKQLLKEGFDPNITTVERRVFKATYSPTSQLNFSTEYGSLFISPLMFVAMTNQVELVKVLIEGGAEVDFKTEYGHTALRMAALYDAIDTVKVLIEAGADINLRGPMRQATVFDHTTGSLRELILAGAEVDFQDKHFFGLTPLTQAAKLSRLDNLNILIFAGADLNLQDIYGNTATHWAVRNNDTDILNSLIQVKAELDKKDIHGNTPTMIAAKKGYTESLDILIKAGADLDLQDKSGRTALILAVQNDEVDSMKMLVKAGADMDIKDAGGNTALDWAYAYSQYDTLSKMYCYRLYKEQNKNLDDCG